MKHAKKSLSIIMSIVLLLSTVSMFSTAYACDGCGDDEYHQSGIWNYILENDEAIIVGLYTEEELYGTVAVPETLDGYPVTGIEWIGYGDYAESWDQKYDLYIPASVVKLTDPDSRSFGSGMKNIIVDEANPAFTSENGVLFNKDKTVLIRCPQDTLQTAYTIPDSVTSIGCEAFWCCDSLKSVKFGNSVTSIDDCAFILCNGLTSISIPDSVTSIGYQAFFGCDSLESVTIGSGVTTISAEAFIYCDKLNSISVDANNQHYSSDNSGVLFNKDKTEIVQYPCGNEKTSYIIPDGVITIGDYAFCYCTSLTSITIGNSVTTIGDWAFYSCEKLADINMPESLTFIGEHAFADCKKLSSVILPEGFTTLSPYAFEWSGIETLYIPASATQIDYLAAGSDSSLKDVYFGGSRAQWNAALKEMNPDDFYYGGDYLLLDANIHYNSVIETASGSCGANASWFFDGMNTLTISGSGEMASYSQGENAPWNKYAGKITKLEIKEGITKIDGFYKLANLETIILPESLKCFEHGVFCWDYGNTKEIIYKGMPEQWENIEFNDHYDDGDSSYDIYNWIIYIDNEDFVIDSIDITVEGSTTVKYGETAYLYADIPVAEADYNTNYFLPVGTHLSWYVDSGDYFIGEVFEEYACAMTSENNGTEILTVCLEDEDGWTIYNDDGEPIEGSITLTSKVGVIELISYFFRELFNILFGWLMF